MKFLLILLVGISIVSCGKSNSSEADQAENEFFNLANGGDCGLNVVNDYENVALSCERMRTDIDLLDCRVRLTQFIEKYPNINCREGSYGRNNGDFYITETDLRNTIRDIDASLRTF